MNVVVIQVFVSLMLVAGSLALFVFSVRQRDLDHSDRLSLAPLEDDARAPDPHPAPEAPTSAAPPER